MIDRALNIGAPTLVILNVDTTAPVRLDHTSEASDAFTLTIQPDSTTPAPGVATITYADDNAGSDDANLQIVGQVS